METFPLGGLVTAGLLGAKRFRENGSLVQEARAGLFIPNGNDDRSHRGATLLALRVAGAGGGNTMWVRRGHFLIRTVNLHLAAFMPSRNFFVLVKIA